MNLAYNPSMAPVWQASAFQPAQGFRQSVGERLPAPWQTAPTQAHALLLSPDYPLRSAAKSGLMQQLSPERMERCHEWRIVKAALGKPTDCLPCPHPAPDSQADYVGQVLSLRQPAPRGAFSPQGRAWLCSTTPAARQVILNPFLYGRHGNGPLWRRACPGDEVHRATFTFCRNRHRLRANRAQIVFPCDNRPRRRDDRPTRLTPALTTGPEPSWWSIMGAASARPGGDRYYQHNGMALISSKNAAQGFGSTRARARSHRSRHLFGGPLLFPKKPR